MGHRRQPLRHRHSLPSLPSLLSLPLLALVLLGPGPPAQAAAATATASVDGVEAVACSAGDGLCENRDAGGDGETERELVAGLLLWLRSRENLGQKGDDESPPTGYGPFRAQVEPVLDLSQCCPAQDKRRAAKEDIAKGVRGHISLYATRAIKAGEPVLRVPRSAIAFRTPVAEEVLPYAGKQLALGLLSSFLLRERAKGRDSEWAPYLRVLPQRVMTHPLYYDANALREFESVPFEQEVERLQRLVVLDYNKVKNPEATANATLEDFKWAYTMVLSRLFSIGNVKPQGGEGQQQQPPLEYIDSPKTMPALVPLADLVDHSLEPNLEWKLGERDLVFYATRAIVAGSPLSHSYGNKSNTQLLGAYGFLFPDNPWDGAQFFATHTAMAMAYSSWRVGREELLYLPPLPPRPSGEGFHRGDIRLLKEVAGSANEAYGAAWKQVEQEKKFEAGRTRLGAQSVVEAEGFGVWPGGYIHPEIIAVLASLASTDYASFRVEPNYGQLIRVALALGWRTHAGDEACTLISNLLVEQGDRDALAAAGEVIRQHAQDLLEHMKESLEEDEALLEELGACSSGQEVVPSQGRGKSKVTALCRTWHGERLAWLKLAVHFRAWKKRTLREISGCCQWACGGE